MARPPSEDTVKDWEARIQRAIQYQRSNGRVDRWENYRNWYHNDYTDNAMSVNLVFALGRALVPQVYFKAPTILVTPEQVGLEQHAKVLEAVDQILIRQMGMKQQLKLGILDAYLTNLAVFKFGYHSIATEVPPARGPEPVPEEIQNALVQLLGEPAVEQIREDDKELKKYSYHDWVRPDAPWMLRVQPEDLLVPFGAKDIHAVPWIAFRVVRPVEDIKRDPTYSRIRSEVVANVSIDSKENSFVESPQHMNRNRASDAVPTHAEIYEIWDKRSGEVKVIQMGLEKYLRKEKHGLNINGLPVEILQFNSVGWDFWGESDVKQIRDQVVEYNETRTMEMLHKKSAVSKFFYDKGAISEDDIDKFTEAKLAAIPVDGNPNTVVSQFSPNMSRDLFAISDVIQDDVREILGFSRNQAGDFDVSRRTATEASIVQQSIQLRSDERRDQVADLLGHSFQRKIHPMLFDFWTAPRSVQVTGLGGWIKFSGEQIRGDYAVTAIPDSVLPLTKAQRQQAATSAMQLFRGDPRINQRSLFQWVITQFEDMGIPNDILLPEEQFQQQQQQNLLQAALQRGGPKQSGPT